MYENRAANTKVYILPIKYLYNGNIDEIAHLCFNARYYADTYPDLKKAYGYNEANLRNHWVTYGIKEGRSGSPILDLKYYIAHNPDLKKAYGTNYGNAYYHFCRFGYAEFRNSSKYYNGTFYHLNHNDLAKYDSLFILNHYMTYGINEKRYGNTIRFTGAISPVSQSKTIPINWDNIAKVGKQAKGSVSCSCFALAYCRTILDNKVHNWSEYNQNGAIQNNVWAMWSWGKYCSATGKNDNEVYTLAYHNINAGKPFIVYVKGGTNARKVNGGHYVAIVGYQNVTSLNSLSANNFLIIDPSSSAPLTGVENMGALAYSLNGCKYVYAQ